MNPRRRPFFHSIRFRLTAWYALLLFALILALGLTYSTLLERRLRADVDTQLLKTAQDIKSQIKLRGDPEADVYGFVPPADLFSFPSLLIQVVAADGTVKRSSANLGDNVLPAAAVTPGSAKPVYETVGLQGYAVRTVHLPIVLQVNNRTVGGVIVGEPLLQLDQTLGHVRRLLVVAGLIGVGLAAGGGWFLAGRSLRPVDRITAAAAAIAADSGSARSLATRLDVPPSGDELARLAATFNRMLDRLEVTFSAQRRFIADASHELRTPLTAIRGNIDVMLLQAGRGDSTVGDFTDALDDLRRESARMSRLIDDLLTLARTDAPPDDAQRRRPVRLDLLVQEAVRTAATLASGQHLAVNAPEPLTVEADPDRILQLLLILLDNAVRHTPPEGAISVALQAAGPTVRLTVRDTGVGIPPEHLSHVFERFYRADHARVRATGGTGLGLAIAQAIARAQGGEIAVASTVGHGTTFTVTLPMAQTDAKTPVASTADAA